MSYQNSPKQSSSSQGSASEQFIKIVEQLIDSDDDEILLKRMIDLQPAFPILKKMNEPLSNQQKVALFLRDHNFRNRLTDKLRDKNILLYDPFVKLQLYSIRHGSPINEQLDYVDIHHIFERFGSILQITLLKNQAYIRYDNYVSAYLAIKTINGFAASDTLKIEVRWCDQLDFSWLEQQTAAISPFDGQEPKKIMGRYDIFMEVNSEFKLSKRIIGPKGNNMKKILSEVLNKSKLQHIPIESIAKIRLRGKGSGFLQGQSNVESDQLLNLCISSKNSQIFTLLCEEIEKLLNKISLEYKDYYYKLHKKMCEGIAYRKYELRKNGYEMIKQYNLEHVNNTLDFIDPQPLKKLKQAEIIKMITRRDEIRKQGRYKQADDIRERLKKQGVLLLDEKHANGKICKTTWKYMFE